VPPLALHRTSLLRHSLNLLLTRFTSFASDVFALVADPFAFVGFRRANFADDRGDLSNGLLVIAFDVDFAPTMTHCPGLPVASVAAGLVNVGTYVINEKPFKLTSEVSILSAN